MSSAISEATPWVTDGDDVGDKVGTLIGSEPGDYRKEPRTDAGVPRRSPGRRGAMLESPAPHFAGIEVLLERADMYAVIKTGGKQYKVAAGEKIKIEQIAADVGQEITISEVLAVGSGADLKVGTPLVTGASVVAKVVAHGRHDKVRIFKMRRRKHYQKRQGHRQNFTEIEIGAVNA